MTIRELKNDVHDRRITIMSITTTGLLFLQSTNELIDNIYDIVDVEEVAEAPQIQFGTKSSTGSNQVYSSATVSPGLQIEDSGSSSGAWRVMITASPFATTDGTLLKGVTLAFDQVGVTGNATATNKVTTNAVSLSANNEAATIMQASENLPANTWTAAYQPADVSLTVPGGNVNGQYTATLTWTVINGE